MRDFPDLKEHRYQITEQLGRNREGGRITWKGIAINTKQNVVIKQFCFAVADSTWSGYKAYEQELKILQKIDCVGVPKYLDSIETKDGFCLIQEYIPASSLDRDRNFTTAEVKQIAFKILEILIYLQAQNPPILHRDLTPENILLDDEFNLYLIDFGFASLNDKELSGSSVFKGTPGFIAPEQIIKATPASDIYSLGMTLVCLLSNKSINEIQDLTATDNPYQLKIDALFPELDRQFLNWLKKTIDAKIAKRFADALTAKEALLAIDRKSDSSNLIVSNFNLGLNNLIKPQIALGTCAITGLAIVNVCGIKLIDRQPESAVVDLAIAIIASIVVGVTQLGAVEIANNEPQARLQGGILAIGIPILLVSAGNLIWGIKEAVDMAATISIAELLLLSYVWWQISDWQAKNIELKSSLWLGAIALGIFLGIKLV